MNDIENADPLQEISDNNGQRISLLDSNNTLPQGQPDDEAENVQLEQASPTSTLHTLLFQVRFNPKLNLIAMVISLSKVIASSTVLATVHICFNVFQILIMLMLIHDCLNLFIIMSNSISVYQANRITNSEPPVVNGAGEDLNSVQREVDLNLQRRKAIRSLTRRLKFGLRISNHLDILYFCLFFTTNILYFIFSNHRSCPSESEDNLLIALLIIGHLWFLGPLTFLIILGLFSPIIPLILHCITKRREQAKARLMKKLKVRKFSNTLPGTHECSICITDYEENDDIVQLQCNSLHHFHNECITPWLKANGKCPLCRVSLEDMYK